MTNRDKLDHIIADIDWQNYEHTEEEQHDGSPEHWDLCEVLFNKLEYLTQLIECKHDPCKNDPEEHIESIRYAQIILGMLDEKKIRRVIR